METVKNQGKFIVFEGGEGSGKTTQIGLLKKTFGERGASLFLTREPGGNGCPIAEKIREMLKDPANADLAPEAELFLFFASRAQHVRQRILPMMRQKAVVVSDRYDGSTVAYQHFGRGLFCRREIIEINRFATGGLKPDLTILLDISPYSGLRRIFKRNGGDRFDNEQLEFHEKVRQGFLALAKEEPNWVVIDADQSVETVHEQIWQHVAKLLGL